MRTAELGVVEVLVEAVDADPQQRTFHLSSVRSTGHQSTVVDGVRHLAGSQYRAEQIDLPSGETGQADTARSRVAVATRAHPP